MKLSRLILVLAFALVSLTAHAQEQKWIRASSAHFLLFTDTTEVKAQRLLTDLEQRVEGFGEAFGGLHAFPFPIEVYLFKDRNDFVTAIPNRPPVNGEVPPEKNAYFITGPDRFFLVAKDKNPDDIANDTAHSLGHAFFEHSVMWRPFWLTEAAGEYFRKLGRDADTKAISEKDGYSVDDLLTIVQSANYQDSEPGGAFRTQSYRLLRLILQEKPQALRDFVKAINREEGKDAKLNIDVEEIGKKFQTFVETPLRMPAVAPAVKSEPVDALSIAVHRGDLLMATERTYEAGRYYNGTSPESRAARAIAARLSRPASESLPVLAKTAQELPDMGLVQYYFGTLAAEKGTQLNAQLSALERAVKLLPTFGRAFAELARVYVLSGKADQALPLLDKALSLEPEHADYFYEIRAQALAAAGRFDDALRTIRVGETLPHGDRRAVEAYTVKVMNMTKLIESARREVDSQKMERIRRDLEAKVNEREPVQVPEPVLPTPDGQINFEIAATTALAVANQVYPQYPEALRKAGRQGKISLRVEVAPDGSVKNAVVATSQVPELNAATIAAVKKWVFKLARARTTPVNITLTFIYTLQ
jgi:TonB family protein